MDWCRDMRCAKPYYDEKTGCLFPCNQCLACRINRRRHWTCRMVLESMSHEHCCFITLTYNDENLPENGSLVPRDLTLFLKRLRKRLDPQKFRYFACGEYGTKSFRPHYHAILFGVSELQAQDIQEAWGLGFTYTAEFNMHTAEYVAGYVCKKLDKGFRDDYLNSGLEPEFLRSSRRPGLGFNAVEHLLKYAFYQGGIDVLKEIRINGKVLPMPKYIREKLRLMLGSVEYFADLNKAKILNYKLDLQKMVNKHFGLFSDVNHYTVASSYYDENKQKIENLESRHKIFNNRSKI